MKRLLMLAALPAVLPFLNHSPLPAPTGEPLAVSHGRAVEDASSFLELTYDTRLAESHPSRVTDAEWISPSPRVDPAACHKLLQKHALRESPSPTVSTEILGALS